MFATTNTITDIEATTTNTTKDNYTSGQCSKGEESWSKMRQVGIDLPHHTKVDQLLEKEKQHNKTESWNKLDKTIKIQKLHGFAEKYGREHALAIKDIKALKIFFKDCLEKNKLQKTKDVIYDKDNHEIQSIPSLFFHPVNRNFTLKIMDPKRVSTLKSLTPKRTTATNHDDTIEESDEK